MNLLELFCHVDDFCQTFKAKKPEKALPNSKKTRELPLSMTASEIMTILIYFLALNGLVKRTGSGHLLMQPSVTLPVTPDAATMPTMPAQTSVA